MAKGQIAKTQVADRIAKAFGNDWIGEYDKKYYVWATENGERLQIAISMTCPKNPVGDVSTVGSNVMNFEDSTPVVQEKKEISEDEKQHIADLMAKLGL